MLMLVVQLVATVILLTAFVALFCMGISTSAHQRMLEQELRELRRQVAILQTDKVADLQAHRNARLHG